MLTVPLYGSESWNSPLLALKVLEGFHTEAIRHLIGMQPICADNGTWEYHKTTYLLKAAPLSTIVDYIAKRRQIVATLIVGRPVFGMYRKGGDAKELRIVNVGGTKRSIGTWLMKPLRRKMC